MHKFTFVFLLFQAFIIVQIVSVNCANDTSDRQPPERKTSRLNQAAKLITGGMELAKTCSYTSVRIKSCIIAGHCVYKGIQTYRETGDVKKAGKAAKTAGLQNAIDVIMAIPGVSLSLTLFNDFKNKENWKTIFMNSGRETIDMFPLGQTARLMTMKTAQAYKRGKSVKQAITEGVKSTWSSEKSEQSPENKVDEHCKPSGLNKGEISTADTIVEDNKGKKIISSEENNLEGEASIQCGREILNSVPMDESDIVMAMTGLSAAQGIQKGKSIDDIIAEGVDGTLVKQTNKHPTVKDLIELWENVDKLVMEDKKWRKQIRFTH